MLRQISILVAGHGDERFVFLAAAFVHQKIIIPATAGAGIIAAGGRARVIDSAAAFFGVEELADAAEVFVSLAAHEVFITVAFARELGLRRFNRHLEVPRQAIDVALVQRNHRIRAAIAGAVQAVILGHLVSGSSARLKRLSP